jgi:hypothetical protein
MTTAAVTTLIDEQIAEIERSIAVLTFAAPVNETYLMPRNVPVSSLPRRVSCTFKGKRVAVRSRPLAN